MYKDSKRLFGPISKVQVGPIVGLKVVAKGARAGPFAGRFRPPDRSP